MTRFSAPAVYRCPGCQACLLRLQICSFGFFGARDWSDGSPSNWWVAQPLVKCCACAAIFWLDDLEPVGELPRAPQALSAFQRMWARWRGDPHGKLLEEQRWLAVPAEWKCASHLAAVDYHDVAFVLRHADGLCRERLVWMRRYLWWSQNDRHRTRSDGTPIPGVPQVDPADEQANREALLELLHQGEPGARDQVDIGELLRQMGRFDEAAAVLRSVVPDGYSEVRASKIERLARRGDRALSLLREEF